MAEDLGFEVAVHAGSMLAVLVFFRKRISLIIRDILKSKSEGRRWLSYIFVGTIPAGIAGLGFKDNIEILFNSVTAVGIAWLFTALILFFGERYHRETTTAGSMGYMRALFIGIAQAVAIIPGVSRSGSTIAAGMAAGVEKKGVVDFIFILSLPAIGGAALLTLKDWFDGSVVFGIEHLVGGVAAGLSGYGALIFLLKMVLKGKLSWFAFYCAAAGITALIMG